MILHRGLSVSDSSSRMLVCEDSQEKRKEEACKDRPLDDEGSLSQNANASASLSFEDYCKHGSAYRREPPAGVIHHNNFLLANANHRHGKRLTERSSQIRVIRVMLYAIYI